MIHKSHVFPPVHPYLLSFGFHSYTLILSPHMNLALFVDIATLYYTIIHYNGVSLYDYQDCYSSPVVSIDICHKIQYEIVTQANPMSFRNIIQALGLVSLSTTSRTIYRNKTCYSLQYMLAISVIIPFRNQNKVYSLRRN